MIPKEYSKFSSRGKLTRTGRKWRKRGLCLKMVLLTSAQLRSSRATRCFTTIKRHKQSSSHVHNTLTQTIHVRHQFYLLTSHQYDWHPDTQYKQQPATLQSYGRAKRASLILTVSTVDYSQAVCETKCLTHSRVILYIDTCNDNTKQ